MPKPASKIAKNYLMPSTTSMREKRSISSTSRTVPGGYLAGFFDEPLEAVFLTA
jgi:hypothetical protein